MTLTTTERRRGMQARGITRRQKLVDSARRLLAAKDLDQISLADIALDAGIPKSSAYHLFPDVNLLYSEFARQMAEQIKNTIACPVTPQSAWSDIFTVLLARGAELLQEDRAACHILLGPKTPLSIKRSERQNDLDLANTVIHRIEEQFLLPDLPNLQQLFFFAIEIFDLFLSLSVLETGKIENDAVAEGTNAALAYLRLHLPPLLPHSAELEISYVR